MRTAAPIHTPPRQKQPRRHNQKSHWLVSFAMLLLFFFSRLFSSYRPLYPCARISLHIYCTCEQSLSMALFSLAAVCYSIKQDTHTPFSLSSDNIQALPRVIVSVSVSLSLLSVLWFKISFPVRSLSSISAPLVTFTLILTTIWSKSNW